MFSNEDIILPVVKSPPEVCFSNWNFLGNLPCAEAMWLHFTRKLVWYFCQLAFVYMQLKRVLSNRIYETKECLEITEVSLKHIRQNIIFLPFPSLRARCSPRISISSTAEFCAEHSCVPRCICLGRNAQELLMLPMAPRGAPRLTSYVSAPLNHYYWSDYSLLKHFKTKGKHSAYCT